MIELAIEKMTFYRPLLLALVLSLLLAVSLPTTEQTSFMTNWMGGFLFFLPFLKLFNLDGFARGFALYDPLAGKYKAYAYAYPFIELAVASLFLSGTLPLLSNLALCAMMAVNSIGVLQTIRSGVCLKCVCVGSQFAIPVGKVTLVENAAMFLMAASSLLALLF